MNFDFAGISITLNRKKTKTLRVSVVPPYGEVLIRAPRFMKSAEIRDFVLSKLNWIVDQQQKIITHARNTASSYVDSEIHMLWGEGVTLRVLPGQGKPAVRSAHGHIILKASPDADYTVRKKAIFKWYRTQLKRAAGLLVSKWEP